MMIALGRVERNTGRYGEWLPDVVGTWPDPPAVRSSVRGPFINWAEKAARDAEDAHRKAAGQDANLNGMFWTVEPAP